MKCLRCAKTYEGNETRCPHCGQPNPEVSGYFQSSSVMIASGRAAGVYRSVDEVPPVLRTRLEESTTGRNSATILIADRRGRREIARAFRDLPPGARRRILRAISLPDAAAAAGPEWLTPRRKRAMLALLVLLALALIFLAFGHVISN